MKHSSVPWTVLSGDLCQRGITLVTRLDIEMSSKVARCWCTHSKKCLDNSKKSIGDNQDFPSRQENSEEKMSFFECKSNGDPMVFQLIHLICSEKSEKQRSSQDERTANLLQMKSILPINILVSLEYSCIVELYLGNQTRCVDTDIPSYFHKKMRNIWFVLNCGAWVMRFLELPCCNINLLQRHLPK